ncbi:MAG: CBS domain-containing protein [Bacteroidales bacterium]|nr:CBS domain-containing protein [Bacteroidales bacterium]
MTAADLQTNNISPLLNTELCYLAIEKIKDANIFQIPVINKENKYLGIVSLDQLTSCNTEKKIEDCELSQIFVLENQTIFEIIEIFYSKKLSILPVITNEQKYFGLITIENINSYFAKLSSFKYPGSILRIITDITSYSIVEIAQIIELHNAKILLLFTNFTNSQATIILKLNTLESEKIIDTLIRYNYEASEFNNEINELSEFYKKRIDSLISYMNI